MWEGWRKAGREDTLDEEEVTWTTVFKLWLVISGLKELVLFVAKTWLEKGMIVEKKAIMQLRQDNFQDEQLKRRKEDEGRNEFRLRFISLRKKAWVNWLLNPAGVEDLELTDKGTPFTFETF